MYQNMKMKMRLDQEEVEVDKEEDVEVISEGKTEVTGVVMIVDRVEEAETEMITVITMNTKKTKVCGRTSMEKKLVKSRLNNSIKVLRSSKKYLTKMRNGLLLSEEGLHYN